MRLDEFDPNSVNVEDQRSSGGGGFPMGGRGGQVGCGTLVVALILSYVLGVDPGQLLGGLQQVAPQEQTSAPAAGTNASESCKIDQASLESCNALSSLNKTWAPIFAASNVKFQQPGLVFYSNVGSSGCGSAQSAMGPFYCPEDQKIYLDTTFYDQMDKELGATGQFARDYVIAHEYGHHIQKLTGISDQIRSAQEQNPRAANQLSVRLELQADCYAGVWAAKNKDRLDKGDMESGLNAAHQIGDDTLMRNAGRNPNEASFTHGSSAQRMEALRRGMDNPDDSTCDVYMQK
ncbi:MAG: neutral zinc metallopeptidase [Novosphingobium sp.]